MTSYHRFLTLGGLYMSVIDVQEYKRAQAHQRLIRSIRRYFNNRTMSQPGHLLSLIACAVAFASLPVTFT